MAGHRTSGGKEQVGADDERNSDSKKLVVEAV